jgi:hypothetical protein
MSSESKKPADEPSVEVITSPSAAAEERRFCSSCSRTKPLLGGVMARCANGTKRWKCADCHARSKAHLASIKKSQ